MTATVIPFPAPPAPAPCLVTEAADVIEQLRATVDDLTWSRRRETRWLCAAALVAGLIVGAAGASFAAPIPPAAEVCSVLVSEQDAHAVQVVPDWPMGLGGEPTDEQVDAIFSAAEEGDPDANAALDIGAAAMARGCW